MKNYEYCGYTITKDGEFISPNDNTITWFDDKYIKLYINGKVRTVNGLNILYEVYNGEPVTKRFVVVYKNKTTKAKTKANLVLKVKSGRSQVERLFSDEEVEQIRSEYGLSEEERRSVKNNLDHPTLSYRSLAKKYNVSINTIQRIVYGTYTQSKRIMKKAL